VRLGDGEDEEEDDGGRDEEDGADVLRVSDEFLHEAGPGCGVCVGRFGWACLSLGMGSIDSSINQSINPSINTIDQTMHSIISAFTSLTAALLLGLQRRVLVETPTVLPRGGIHHRRALLHVPHGCLGIWLAGWLAGWLLEVSVCGVVRDGD
jgi:hypothetical protein